MYRAVTRQIEVTVEPNFLPERSSIEHSRYFWSYTIVIINSGEETVQLRTRYWIITDAAGRQQEVRVVVGLDQASPAMQDLVLIGAPARLGQANFGTVAVIAPTRIQYQEMIHAVRYIAGLSERILEIPTD